jgi:charged multivesicular body protein 6
MGNLFGVRRRAPQITDQDRAILQLKQQRDKIKIYQKRTEAELAKNTELALNLFKNGMKDRAIIVLRRKKMMEDILTRTDKQLETLESLVADIEYTQIEVSVVEGLKVGSEALKQLNSLMNIEDIQRMMEDNAEAYEKQREISAILSQSSERYAEDDLLKELEKYQADATEAKLQELPTVPDEVKPNPVEVQPAEEEVQQTSELPEKVSEKPEPSLLLSS